MDFTTYLNQSWAQHAAEPQKVADSFIQGLNLAQNSEQQLQLARLVTHVYGEHLGQWSHGIEFLKRIQLEGENLSQLKIFECSLSLSENPKTEITQYTNSEKIRILALSASALSEHKQTERAQDYFLKAIALAGSGLTSLDPANRTLAVTGNNLACALEEKAQRSPAETELMILAARTGRKFWEVAGTWLETERAEYRLSQTYLKAGLLTESLQHAKLCLQICENNQAPALEFFFAYECLALAEKEIKNELGLDAAVSCMKVQFEMLSDDDKNWCQTSLNKFK